MRRLSCNKQQQQRGRRSFFFFFLFLFFFLKSRQAAVSFSPSIWEMYMFQVGALLFDGDGADPGSGVRGGRRVLSLGEGEAAYCESMPTHWVLMQFHLGHVSRLERHHERRQAPRLSARPGQDEDEEAVEEEEQQQLCNRIKFIAPLSAAVSLRAKAARRN